MLSYEKNSYDYFKRALSTHRGYQSSHGLTTTDYLATSGAAGALTAVLTNPIWVIKTRMLSSARTAPGAYKGMVQGLRHILRDEGIRGLYRGLIPSMLGVSHGAVQFAVYEMLKKSRFASRNFNNDNRSRRVSGNDKPSTLSTIVFSATSKTVAIGVTYPYQLVRARLQTYDAASTYRSLRDVVVKSWRREGVMGFYKGLAPSLLRVLPTTCVTFVTYENCRFYLSPVSDCRGVRE